MDATPQYRLVRPPRVRVPAPELDDDQRAVVDHSGGPLLVVAGPGTGKTTTLVEAAAARVDAGVPVEDLLLLTFSRRAAGELRERLTARLGRTVRDPVARTIHSYAFGVLRMAALRADPPAPAPRLLAAAEQDVIIRELLASTPPDRWPSTLTPALRTEGFAAELRDLLMRAVERGYDGPALAELGRQRGRADWVAAGAFLAEYHGVTVLRDPGGYDPAELIRGALNALRDNPELLAEERARRRHVFVDEYQDTDPAQGELLALLADGADELILVGDPDQSIYAFRGADESALRTVDERFGGGGEVPVIALHTARRFGPDLLAATRRVAQLLPGPAQQRELRPADPDTPGRVDVALFRTHSEEAAYVAATLRRAYLDGTPWSRMAVLVRSTVHTVGGLRRAMIAAGVPVSVRSDDVPLAESPAVRVLLDVLAVVVRGAEPSEAEAEALLSGPIGRGDALYLRRLRRVLRNESPAAADELVPVVSDPREAELLPSDVRWAALRVARTLAAGRAAVAESAGPESVLWAIWQASGLARQWERASAGTGLSATAANRDLDAVVSLFDAAARFTDRLPGANAAQFAEHVDAQQIPADTFAIVRPEPNAVSIVTAHGSKGLEWDLVCVAGVQEGSWPDLRRRGSLLGTEQLVDIAAGLGDVPVSVTAPQLAEERRLFYVAATRARRELLVTAVRDDDEQPSRFLDELAPGALEADPRPPISGVHLPGLVAQLRAVVCDSAAPGEARQAAAGELARLAAAGVRGAHPDSWWGLSALSTVAGVIPPDEPVRVGPSKVEAFLTCELQSLLRDLGVQDSPAAAAEFGTLIHAIAAELPADATQEEFEQRLDAEWGRIDFGADWYASNQRTRAGEMLARLGDWLRTSRAELDLLAVERGFRIEFGGAVINGKVDRLERDGAGRLVVVDLKTGKSKPRAEELDANPQLGVYQLAIEHGAFPEHGTVAGGGRLVQLGATGPIEQVQVPLAEADDPDWPAAAVEHVVLRMHGHEFDAVVNSRCQICDVKASCPLQDHGRQVPT